MNTKLRTACSKVVPSGTRGLTGDWGMRPQGKKRGGRKHNQMIVDQSTSKGYRLVTVGSILTHNVWNKTGDQILSSQVRGKVGGCEVVRIKNDLWRAI